MDALEWRKAKKQKEAAEDNKKRQRIIDLALKDAAEAKRLNTVDESILRQYM